MKKRFLILGLLITVFTFGCSARPEPLHDTEEIEDIVEEADDNQDVAAISDVADDKQVDVSEVAEDNSKDTEVEKEDATSGQGSKVMKEPTVQVLSDMFSCLDTYCGITFMEDAMPSFYTLTNEEVFVMTGLACATTNYEAAESIDQETGYPVFSEKTFKEMQKNLFADQFANAYDESAGNMFAFKTDKGVSTLVGDLGTMQPRHDIVSVVQKDDAFVVTADYYAFDLETQEKMEDYCTATAIFTIVPSDESVYGYVISDMSFEVAE